MSNAAKDKMEELEKVIDDEIFKQPHTLLFSWAFHSNVNTDRISITTAILRGQNIQPRSQKGGERKHDYIFYLNDILNKYMERMNDIWAQAPIALKYEPEKTEFLSCLCFSLAPLRERMRTLVASRGSDCRRTPATVREKMSPKLFFLLCGDYADRTTCTASTISIVFRNPCELDFLFPPTSEDLLRDGTRHPHFGHLMTSRWYQQMYDDVTASNPHPDTVLRALSWEVSGYLSLRFFRRSNTTFMVDCMWTGKNKRASGKGSANGSEWIEPY